MRLINIATADNATALQWNNTSISFDELCDKAKDPIRTPETVVEYQNMTKTDRSKAKDHGGFVGGFLLDGRRKLSCVKSRSVLTMDVDEASVGFIEEYIMLSPYTSFVYTTHSHTPENPRVRIIVLLKRDVSCEEYIAIARYFAEKWGIDMFDSCSYMPHQLMFWPSAPCDGEYIFKRIDGVELDPDQILNDHPDWKDPLSLPRSSKESSVKSIATKKQQDPMQKSGIVGAFCRAYPICEAISTFLQDVYCPSSDPRRYDYIPGESHNGVIIYEDKFAYSFHETDPVHCQLVNSFDIVRIHRFGTGSDSYEKMVAFATSLDKVKKQLVKDRHESVINDFSEAGDPYAEDGNSDHIFQKTRAPDNTDTESHYELDKAVTINNSGDNGSNSGDSSNSGNSRRDDNNSSSKVPEDTWQRFLRYDSKDQLLNTVWNLLLILHYDKDYKNIAYNEFTHRVQITGPVHWKRPDNNPFWRDADYAQLKSRVEFFYKLFSDRVFDIAFRKTVDDRRFHPVRDYLNNLPLWDGKKRVDTLLVDYLGAEDNEYTRAVTRKTLVAAVARVFCPGIKFDYVLVLIGPQGIGKSTFFYKISGDWFSDSLTLTDMKDKAAAEKLQGIWIMELSEMAGMKKAEIETVKSFVSRTDDNYRPAYGKTSESHPRQFIIVGTSNTETGFLRDITGNRRFWPVKVSGNSPKTVWNMSEETILQIWAECLYYFQSGETIYLDNNISAMAKEAQREAMETDEREGLVRSYLDSLLPKDWPEMNITERRDFLKGNDSFQNDRRGALQRETVSNMEIWCECFEKDASMLKKSDSYEIAAIMRKIEGWERSDKKADTPYGRQRIYMRIPNSSD